MYHDGDVAKLWHDVGDVSIWNTKDDLKIAINPGEGLWIKEVSIHVVQDPADFDASSTRTASRKSASSTTRRTTWGILAPESPITWR